MKTVRTVMKISLASLAVIAAICLFGIMKTENADTETNEFRESGLPGICTEESAENASETGTEDEERYEKLVVSADAARGTKNYSNASSSSYTPTPIPELRRISAYYRGGAVVVGEPIERENITVKGYFSNGTTRDIYDFELSDEYVWEVGTSANIITVYYEDQSAEIRVTGKEQLEIVRITATYKGKGVIVSNEIPRSDIECYVHYNWPEMKPDLITNFEMYPETVEYVGQNRIEICYDYLDPVTITVQGLSRKIEKIEATYLGSGVEVGDYVFADEMEVLAFYNDGSMEEVYDFNMTGDYIARAGKNNVIISYRGKVVRVEVEGVEETAPISAKDVFRDWVIDTDASTVVTLMVSDRESAQTMWVDYVPWEEIENAVSRVAYTSMYLGFEVGYIDPEAVTEFPIYCKVQRPYEFDPDRFGIYYSPNKKTIMAKVQGEWLSDDMMNYVFTMYEPGTYIMIDTEAENYVTSINLESTDLKLKVGRNYALNPVVLPKSATNTNVTYWCSDDSVATVNEKGKIKTLAPGTCEIWIEAEDWGGAYTVVNLTVTEK